MSWGYNGDGTLGLGDTTNRDAPVLIPNLTDVDDIMFFNTSVYAILKNKTMQTAKITKSKAVNYIAIRVESNESRVLDYFLNKVLNKPFIIKKLELNKNYIDLQIGIK